jgi:hypothetical protein
VVTMTGFEDYEAELKAEVCSRCIARLKGAPPCAPKGVGCGIERHVEKLVDICRSEDCVLIDPYLDRLHEDICQTCEFRDTRNCPCPLEYLLPLAVRAVENVDRQRRTLGERLARQFRGVQETD